MAGKCLKITILWGLDVRFFYELEKEDVRKQTKKALNLANILENGKPQAGDVFISSFLPSTGGQGSEQRHFNSWAEGQDSLGQAAMCDYSNKSNREQIKGTVPTWSQN